MRVNRAGCWIWQLRKNESGYGVMDRHGRTWRAHRISYFMFNKDAPLSALINTERNTLVLHKCDMRECINPAHLFLGTDKINVNDAQRKGRFPVGERRVQAKLTNTQAREIKQLLRDGFSQYTIAGIYSVSRSAILQIKRGKAWKHVE